MLKFKSTFINDLHKIMVDNYGNESIKFIFQTNTCLIFLDKGDIVVFINDKLYNKLNLPKEKVVKHEGFNLILKTTTKEDMTRYAKFGSAETTPELEGIIQGGFGRINLEGVIDFVERFDVDREISVAKVTKERIREVFKIIEKEKDLYIILLENVEVKDIEKILGEYYKIHEDNLQRARWYTESILIEIHGRDYIGRLINTNVRDRKVLLDNLRRLNKKHGNEVL